MKKNLYKAALLAALGIGSVTAAQAQTTDVLLGFNDANGPASAQNDYVLDLGVASAFTTTASLNFNISSTTFASAFGSDSMALTSNNHVAAGVVEGNPATGLWFSTSTPLSGLTAAGASPALGYASSVLTTPVNYASSTVNGWSYYIAQSPLAGGANVAGSFANDLGNPMQFLNNGVVQETLYGNQIIGSGRNATLAGYTALGTLGINANNDTISFTGVAVPEPSTYGLLACAGLLLVAIRRQISRKNA
jgi:hypothetical protein